MSTGERFDDAELATIVGMMEDEADIYSAAIFEGSPPRFTHECGWCHRRVPSDRRADPAAHTDHCQGMARLRIAAKARAMQAGVGGGR